MKVAEIIMTLYQYAMCNEDVLPFHILVEDPAGNSYIQNPKAPLKDPNMKVCLHILIDAVYIIIRYTLNRLLISIEHLNKIYH